MSSVENTSNDQSFTTVKPKRGRPKRNSVQNVIDEDGNFNLRAFLRVAIKPSDLTDGKLSDELMLSIYNNAVAVGYKNMYKQFACTCRFVVSQKRKELEQAIIKPPVSV